MSWEKKPTTPWAQGFGGALRHPDGSPDIAAYRKIAQSEREAAIVSAVTETMRIGRATLSAIGRVLGQSGRTQLNAPPRR